MGVSEGSPAACSCFREKRMRLFLGAHELRGGERGVRPHPPTPSRQRERLPDASGREAPDVRGHEPSECEGA